MPRPPDQGKSKGTPWWVWLFAVICGVIPVLAVGGAIPMMIGIGGASLCFAIIALRGSGGQARHGETARGERC